MAIATRMAGVISCTGSKRTANHVDMTVPTGKRQDLANAAAATTTTQMSQVDENRALLACHGCSRLVWITVALHDEANQRVFCNACAEPCQQCRKLIELDEIGTPKNDQDAKELGFGFICGVCWAVDQLVKSVRAEVKLKQSASVVEPPPAALKKYPCALCSSPIHVDYAKTHKLEQSGGGSLSLYCCAACIGVDDHVVCCNDECPHANNNIAWGDSVIVYEDSNAAGKKHFAHDDCVRACSACGKNELLCFIIAEEREPTSTVYYYCRSCAARCNLCDSVLILDDDGVHTTDGVFLENGDYACNDCIAKLQQTI